ncbi:MAG: DUF2164 domain-containing protein [Bacteroidota bacterium]
MSVRLSGEAKKRIATQIKVYLRDEWNEEIGDLRAGLFVDFLLETVGPPVYNQGIRDAQRHLARVVADLDMDLHEPES